MSRGKPTLRLCTGRTLCCRVLLLDLKEAVDYQTGSREQAEGAL